jgi:signal transduction histidine kinase
MKPTGIRPARWWHNLPIRYKCAWVVALPVMCLLFEIAWQARVLQSLEDAQGWTTHTQEVELTVAELQRLLVQIESYDRGYGLTGKNEFLAPLKAEEEQVPVLAERLCRLVADNPAQLARARNLRELSQSKLLVAQDVVSYFSAHPLARDAATVPPELGMRLLASKERMDEFMLQSSIFTSEEQRLLGQRTQQLQTQRRLSRSVLWLSLITGLIVGVIAVLVFGTTVADRLTALEAESRCIAGGELMAAPPAGEDEVSNLAWSLHSASHRIQDQMLGLEMLNRDLESFSYSVSHDLRSPLRHIHGFSKILRADFSAELPAEAQRYLSRIESGAERMGHLIDDLLNFAKIGRREPDRQPVSLMPLVQDLVKEINESATREIEWLIQPLPTAQGDPAMVKQVLANLLGNAAKFTRTRERPLVEVGSRVFPQGTAIYVRDNGVGFDMKFADKLFGVFQRLHRMEDFEGTGVGLATVARIVHKHGGTVWAESAPDQGATFYFTLGKALLPQPVHEEKIESQREVVYAAAR